MERTTSPAEVACEAIGAQAWRNVLCLHFPWDADALSSLLPAELAPDRFDGRAWLTVAAFSVEAASALRDAVAVGKLRGVDEDFLEVVVQAAVTHQGVPGTYLFSLDVSRREAIDASRVGVMLPWFLARQKQVRAERVVEFFSMRSAPTLPSFFVRAAIDDDERAFDALDVFLLARSPVFTQQRGGLFSVPLVQRATRCRRAQVLALQDDLCTAAGIGPAPSTPTRAHFLERIDVEFWPAVAAAWTTTTVATRPSFSAS